MPVKLVNGQVNTGGQDDKTFTSNVQSACVLLSGFKLAYEDLADAPEGVDTDHHVKQVAAEMTLVSMHDTTVVVHGDGEIEDDSGHSGGGDVEYLLLAAL